MSDYFCIAVTYLDQCFHGRGDGGEPEWPPSPLRLIQAIVAANGDHLNADGELEDALTWLEQQKPPLIISPAFETATPYCLSVPNNAMDIVAKAWSRGNYFGSGDANPATHRTMKTVRPIRMLDGDTIHYAWKLGELSERERSFLEALSQSTRRIVALGWGIDLVVSQGNQVSATELQMLAGERWIPASATGPRVLRTPSRGTLRALFARYEAFLNRITDSGYSPVEPLTQFDVTGYRRATDAPQRPFVGFELRYDDGSFCAYSQRKLIHLAGMVRHLAKESMMQSPPTGVENGWVERYVAGHHDASDAEHQQFSYLPLPSIGHHHADQSIRRVMVAGPVGDDVWLDYLARRLEGQRLIPERGDEFGGKVAPTLLRVYQDNVARYYTQPSNRWASVTPVILPGHDDRKPSKTIRLIEKALAQSGIDQPCEFDWSPYSHFRKSFSAHKYGKDKRPAGYFRPDHLQSQTAVHLTIRFNEGVKVAGPIAIGAGRHCGFGLMAVPLNEN